MKHNYKRTPLVLSALLMMLSLPLSACGIENADKDSVLEAADTIKDAAKTASESELFEEIKETAKEAAEASQEIAAQNAAEASQDVAGQNADANESTITKEDLGLHDTDGSGKNYSFTYKGEEFTAIYTTDNWKVRDSYRITSLSDIKVVCQALIDEHPVHGKDMVSFRTADDMADEWQIHNIAYEFLEDDDPLKEHAKDVDLDPKDQGLTLEELYKSRTGKDLDINAYLGSG